MLFLLSDAPEYFLKRINMKHVFFFLFFLFLFSSVWSQQLTTTVDSYTGDVTVSTGFDTLSAAKTNEKNSIPDRVVGVKTTHKKKSEYWLFFYFSTSDITNHPVHISKNNFAYFVQTNNEYLRMPYTGKQSTYSGKDNAGFFINITNYISRLQSSEIKIIRFETSQLYHEIILLQNKTNSIANIVNKLSE